MGDKNLSGEIVERPALLIALGCYAIVGCIIFAIAILIADFVVPDHNWLADTISDLGAGKYEFIVDIGIYAFSASVIAIALSASHAHLGEWDWSAGIVGLALLALLIFLIGARNEYGDNDNDGLVIHVYLVYALGLLMVAIPLLMARGAHRAGAGYCIALTAIAVVWAISAPMFFFLPTAIDGIYERYLGLIAFGLVCTLARLFIQRGRKI